MKLIIRALIASLIIVTLTGCKSVEKFAQSALYPFDRVEKSFPPEVVPTGWIRLLYDENRALFFDSPSETLIIYAHGNGENLETLRLSGMLDALVSLGHDVIAFDYPGQGNSLIPSEETMRQSLLTIIESESERPQIILIGRSIGAAVVAQSLPSEFRNVQKIALISPWTTMLDAAKSVSFLGRMIPESFIEKNRYDTEGLVKTYGSAYDGLIIHGDADELIPMKLGLRVRNSFMFSHFVQIPETGHNDIFNKRETWAALREFVQ